MNGTARRVVGVMPDGFDVNDDDIQLYVPVGLDPARQEIGIRMALGAQGGNVLGMVLGQGALIAGTGVVIGVVGSIWLTRLLTSMLFGVSTTDAVTFLLAPLVLAAVALAECFILAWRATRLNPLQVLRQE